MKRQGKALGVNPTAIQKDAIERIAALGASLAFTRDDQNYLWGLAVPDCFKWDEKPRDLHMRSLHVLSRNPRAAYQFIFAIREFVDEREANVIRDTLLDSIPNDHTFKPESGYEDLGLFADGPIINAVAEVARRLGRTVNGEHLQKLIGAVKKERQRLIKKSRKAEGTK